MKLFSKIHGEIEYQEEDIINFKNGILGFENLKKFIIVDLKEYEPFKLLQSIEENEIGLVVISPYDFFNDYEIKLNERTIDELDIKSPEEVMIINTVTIHSDAKKTTANLQGPIIINKIRKLGMQIIVDDPKCKIKQPLIKE